MKTSMSILLWFLVIPTSFTAEVIPDWYDKKLDCVGCVVKYGAGLPCRDEAEAIRSAMLRAYTNLAVEEMGLQVEVSSTQTTSNKSTIFNEIATGAVTIGSIPSTVMKKVAVRVDDDKFVGFVQLKFDAVDIAREKENRKKLADAAFARNLAAITVPEPIGHHSELFGELVIKGLPKQTKVLLNEELVSLGEAAFPRVGIGEYAVRFLKEKYYPLEAKVTIEPGRRTFLEVELQPIIGEIEIITTPTFAELHLDGKLIGFSPLKMKLPIGDYRLAIHKVGFAMKEFVIVSDADKLTRYQIALKEPRRW